MNLEFTEIKCPKCGGELQNINTQVSQDVQMAKRCSNRFEQSKLCQFWMMIVVPNDNFNYSIERWRKTEEKTEAKSLKINNINKMEDKMEDNQNHNPNQQGPASTTTPKIYLGNLQEKARQSGDKFLTGSLCLTDIANIPKEHIQKGNNNKDYVRVIINPYKNGANEYGNTHSVSIDTFKPQKQD